MIELQSINIQPKPNVVASSGPVEVGDILKLRIVAEIGQNGVLISECFESANSKTGIAGFETPRPIRAGYTVIVSGSIGTESGLLHIRVHQGVAEVAVHQEGRCQDVGGGER